MVVVMVGMMVMAGMAVTGVVVTGVVVTGLVVTGLVVMADMGTQYMINPKNHIGKILFY